MKKVFLMLIIFVFMAGIIITGCSKKDEPTTSPVVEPPTYTNTPTDAEKTATAQV